MLIRYMLVYVMQINDSPGDVMMNQPEHNITDDTDSQVKM